MKSVEMNVNHSRYVAVGAEIYFLVRLPYSTHLLPTTCPHRGGPLHMGEMADDGQLLICPWHTSAYKVCNLEKKAPPVVRVRDQISAIIGEADHCTPLLKYSRYGAGFS